MPKVVVLAGINGAGKTSASYEVVSQTLKVKTFVNADAIARGLNGFEPEREAVRAGRIMLEQLDALAAAREDFALETTLAARTYAARLHTLRVLGYDVYLFYYWLNDADMAVARVATRVQAGGHHIPEETIRRRYAKSVANFLELYRPLADYWEVWDNSQPVRVLLGCGDQEETLLDDPKAWNNFTRSAEHG